MNTFSKNFFRSSDTDPSIELYPEEYCDIVVDVTEPTCLETSIIELWAKDGFTNANAKIPDTEQKIIDDINEKKFSEVFLYDKDFPEMLGGIRWNASGHITGMFIKTKICHNFFKVTKS